MRTPPALEQTGRSHDGTLRKLLDRQRRADDRGRRPTRSSSTSATRRPRSPSCDEVEEAHGPIDLWFANAGVAHGGGADAPDDVWAMQWHVNVMAHVYAARALLPGWIAAARVTS